MVAARGHARATSCFTPLPRRVWTTPRTPSGTRRSLSRPHPLLYSLSLPRPSGARRRRRRYRGRSHPAASPTRPRASPRPPPPLPPSHAPPEAPNILPELISYLRPAGRRRPNSWNSGRSRASRAPLRDRCELLHPFPLFPASFDRRSRRPLYGRNAPPPELNVGVAPVTIWSRACAQRAPRIA